MVTPEPPRVASSRRGGSCARHLLAVIEGIDRFEARSSLQAWLFRILINRMRTRAHRDRRSVKVPRALRTIEEA